jgi:mercuric ion binding protein
MAMQKMLLTVILASLFTTLLTAQTGMVKKTTKAAAAEKTETFLVLGNCGMCQRIIEKAAVDAGATKAGWDMDTDQMTVTFDPAKTSADAIQKAVALSGYDNVGYKAPDAVYNDLHGCCKYDRTGAPSTAKSCTETDAPKN